MRAMFRRGVVVVPLDALVSSRMKAAGHSYVNIDEGLAGRPAAPGGATTTRLR